MKRFMDEDFLLGNETASRLYHDFAVQMPIIDYHCHLNARDIAEDKKYRNMTEVWLDEDHYKWHALRSNGIEEKYINGTATEKEKFLKWAETMPYCIGNPLYHWTHLELRRYFGIEKILSPETAEEIWDTGNELLQTDEFYAKNLIRRSNVKVICTTDDPADSLEHHKAIAADDAFDAKVLPTFRADRCIYIEKDGYTKWIKDLSKAAEVEIRTIEDLKDALEKRIVFFDKTGCRLSDHSLETVVFEECTDKEAGAIFTSVLQGNRLSLEEVNKYKTHVMLFLAGHYARLGWTMQLHMGPTRNNNRKMMKLLGPDRGFDAIGDHLLGEPLVKLFNEINDTSGLPRTILYCLNPKDYEVVISIAGCFQDSEVAHKIQLGPAWWFNDQKDGIRKQLTVLSNIGLLGRFIGMLTDSRSLLSYTRHEYFRRILCNLLGEWVENGEAPDDMSLLGNMVQDICFNNAKRYFGFTNLEAL